MERTRSEHVSPRTQPEESTSVGLNLEPIEGLLALIDATYRPHEVWLFGSRARGNARPESDWDLFVVVPDDASDSALDPLVAWRLTREAHVAADVIPCRLTDFRENQNTVNTLSYIVAREGVRVRGR